MSTPRKPDSRPASPPVPDRPERRKPQPAANPRLQQVARWQRFQRYVWDKGRG